MGFSTNFNTLDQFLRKEGYAVYKQTVRYMKGEFYPSPGELIRGGNTDHLKAFQKILRETRTAVEILPNLEKNNLLNKNMQAYLVDQVGLQSSILKDLAKMGLGETSLQRTSIPLKSSKISEKVAPKIDSRTTPLQKPGLFATLKKLFSR